MLWSCSYVGSLCISKNKSKLIQVEQSKKGWERPKITLEKIVKYDMSIKSFFFFKENKQTRVNFTNHDMPYIYFFFQLKTLFIL